MAEVVSKQQVKNVNAIEMATWLQKRCNGLQKLGRVVCRMPVRFRFEIPAAADPALISAYARACNPHNQILKNNHINQLISTNLIKYPYLVTKMGGNYRTCTYSIKTFTIFNFTHEQMLVGQTRVATEI